MKITPDLTHVIKACAWDAFYASSQIEAKTAELEIDRKNAAQFIAIMDKHLQLVGEKLAHPETFKPKEKPPG